MAGPRTMASRGLLSTAVGYLLLASGAALMFWILQMLDPTRSSELSTRSWFQYWSKVTGPGGFRMVGIAPRLGGSLALPRLPQSSWGSIDSRVVARKRCFWPAPRCHHSGRDQVPLPILEAVLQASTARTPSTTGFSGRTLRAERPCGSSGRRSRSSAWQKKSGTRHLAMAVPLGVRLKDPL